jgi:hypothetical protein
VKKPRSLEEKEEDAIYERFLEFRAISEVFERELSAMDVEVQRSNKDLIAQYTRQPRMASKQRRNR